MRKENILRTLLFILFSSLFITMILNTTHFTIFAAGQEFYGAIEYINYIDGTNLTTSMIYINITIFQNAPHSLWLIVPKDWKGPIITSNNLTVYHKLYPLYTNGEENPFYANLTISYNYYGNFSLTLSYSHPYTLLIVEPNAVYFSPMIGHSTWLNRFFIIKMVNVNIKGVRSALPLQLKSKIIGNGLEATVSDNTFNRVILFLITSDNSTFIKLSNGNLTIKTPERYSNVAYNLLNQISNIYYNTMIKLFNTDLGNVSITFYVPESQDDFSVGGYVPYSGGQVGDIYINLLYYRGIEGELSLITLHELVHRFLFKLGLDPNKVLWVHEGLAEYISISLISDVPASIERKNSLETIARNLTTYGFVENWRPGESVNNILTYYAASYFVFKKLGEMYGGLNGYNKVFKLLMVNRVSSTRDLVEVLNTAWNTNLTLTFINWGFMSLQHVQYNVEISIRRYIENTANTIASLPWWLQPIKWIAEFFINLAKDSLDNNKIFLAIFYTIIALIFTYGLLMQLVFVLLLAVIIVIIVTKLHKRKFANG